MSSNRDNTGTLGSLTGTVIGPLTTTFRPPPSCLTDIYSATNTADSLTLFLGGTSQPECYPTHFPNPRSVQDNSYVAYFSPGVCPSGYKIKCLEFERLLHPKESGALCCPSGYTCQPLNTEYPESHLVYCTSVLQEERFAIVGPGATKYPIGVLIPAGSTITAAAVRVRWQATDISTTSAVSDKRSARIAVGVLVPLFCIAIGVAAFLICRRRALKTAPIDPDELDQSAGMEADPVKHELPAVEVLFGTEQEAPGQDPRGIIAEISSNQPHHELPGHPVSDSSDQFIRTHSSTAPTLQSVKSGVQSVVPRKPIPYQGQPLFTNTDPEISALSPQPVRLAEQPLEASPIGESQDSPLAASTGARTAVVEDEELRWMIAEQEKLNARRERLRALDEIDAAEMRLQERIQERIALVGRGSS